MVSRGQDASPIQISSKSVYALWSYSDFTIFQYDYSWPFGLQNYGLHLPTRQHFGLQILVHVLPVGGPQVRTSAGPHSTRGRFLGLTASIVQKATSQVINSSQARF